VWDHKDVFEQRVSSRDVVGAWLLACTMALVLVLVSLIQPFIATGSPGDRSAYTQVAGD
jgi:hypothetical protein